MSTETENDNLSNEGAGEGTVTAVDNTIDANAAAAQQADVTPVQPELNDELVSTYLKTRSGKDFGSIDDLFVEKTIEVNPYKDLLEDSEAKSFLDFKKDTGRGLQDYLKLQENINDISPKDLAIAKVENELGAGLTREDLVEYIQEKINVDIDSLDDLSELEIRKLNLFTKDYKEKLLAEQEKYKTPLAKEKTAGEGIETITLENGMTVDKKVYEDHLIQHQAYQKEIKVAVDSVAKTSLNVEIENAGQKEVLTFDYEYDADDKREMISLSADIDQTIANLFRTEKGFDYPAFAQALLRLDPKSWEKQAAAIAHKARAQAIEELSKVGNNVNLQQDTLQSGNNGKPGVIVVPVSQLFNQ
jgi:hypothetical protein